MDNIAIIFGGKSVEHDISIITALQTMKNISKKYNLIPIYIKPDGRMVCGENLTDEKTFLDYEKNVKKEMEILPSLGKREFAFCQNQKIKKRLKIDAAILCCHGHGGEDGCLQGLLELCEIPYSSPSLPSSALCIDKTLTKIMLKNAQVNTPAYVHFDKSSFEANKEETISKISKTPAYPCIVKPANLGSSVGISICEDKAKIEKNIENAFLYDDKIIVEKFLAGAREFCCAVLKIGDKMIASKVAEVTKSEFYTFEEKYLRKGSQSKEIDDKLEKEVKEMAVRTFNALECDGVVRVDFLYDEKSKKLYVNELNTIPGSLAFNLFDASFEDLLNMLIKSGKDKKEKQNENLYKFSSVAIENYINMACSEKLVK
ncbi:MAG: D-alanine--D-alanine ligase [Clostridia bacterium]|nr:D-alanine--D-alanine ligase [Clostridia bacterium]